MSRRAFVIVPVNAESLPASVPGWLIDVVDLLAQTRDALLEVERAVSVVVAGQDEAKSKADRCGRLLEAFTGDHGLCLHAVAKSYAVRRGELPADLAASFGADIGALLIACSNVAYRARVLRQLAVSWPSYDAGNTTMALVLLGAHAEACPGQGTVLDWIATYLVGQGDVSTEHTA